MAWPSDLRWWYRLSAVAAVAAFFVGGVALALTLPYHDYDSFAFGGWSRLIAEHGKIDPLTPGPLASARPVYYELQGALWSITGISFVAARLLSLAFALGLIAAVWLLARRLGVGSIEQALAPLVVVAIPAFGQDALAGKSDVPAAAFVALSAALAVGPRFRHDLPAVAGAALFAALTKPTVLVPLAVLACVLFLRARPRAIALACGLAGGVIYDAIMGWRFHLGVVAYLRTGTTDGLWAQRAASQRWDAILRADVLGEGLRVPLLFGLVYALLRLARQRHRVAVVVALPAALVWSIAGPYAAHVPGGPFDSAESGFALIGFALLCAAALAIPDAAMPSVALALALPALAVWAYATPYFTRLAATAWPGLAIVIAVAIGMGARGLRRFGMTSALAPIPILAAAVWLSLGTLDGLHGYQWVEYRSLGWSGVWNDDRTLNIVLPAVQESLAAIRPALGDRGRLSTSSPVFAFFLPGRVTTTTALHCADLRGYRGFILSTADENETIAREAGGLATPEQWLACAGPRLHQLTNGSDGLAAFSVFS